MKSSAQDIATILLSSGVSDFTMAETLFVGKEPTKPDNCVTVFDTYGAPPQLTLDEQGLEHPTIQIRVRNTSYTAGWEIIDAIKNYLHGKNQVHIGSTYYAVIYCASGPVLLDWDDNSRARFICNFSILRR